MGAHFQLSKFFHFNLEMSMKSSDYAKHEGLSRLFRRRDFIQLAGISAITPLFSLLRLPETISRYDIEINWPEIDLKSIPDWIGNILNLVPDMEIDDRGYLNLLDGESIVGRVPLVQTQWNKDRNHSTDMLSPLVSWGIVLHWFGDNDDFDKTIEGYIRGFDSMRMIEDEMGRTSAHFLIGDLPPSVDQVNMDDLLRVVQTQEPNPDGNPYIGSHLRKVDYEIHEQEGQYFVRALYTLGYKIEPDSGRISVLQDIYDGYRMDPNYRTIAVEIQGRDFDEPEHYPSDQKLANVLAVVWSVMRRYKIKISDVFGHNEVQLSKADPGKVFMQEIRFLLGVKALVENDDMMKELIFGQFFNGNGDGLTATKRYFTFVRDYMVLVGTPKEVYQWEARSKFWFFYDQVFSPIDPIQTADRFKMPLIGSISVKRVFLEVENKPGVDLSIIDPNPDNSGPSLIHPGRSSCSGTGRRMGRR
jgi:hypothetical protein